MVSPAIYRTWTTLQYFRRYSSSPEANIQNTAKIYLFCVVVGTKGLLTHAGFGAPTQKAHTRYPKRPSQRREMSQRLVNGILVLNTNADILGNSSDSSFHGEPNGILRIGVLLPYHQEILR